MSKRWTENELLYCVGAYLEMLALETQGKPYKKSDFNEQLRKGPLNNRTRSSVEYRMQNISTVLEELCLPRIKGYLPAKNVGRGVKQQIVKVLEKLEVLNTETFKATTEEESLNQRVKLIREKFVLGAPQGQSKPSVINTRKIVYYRDPLVKAWVLENAKGMCECCNEKAPFIMENGHPFLEIHHIKPLSEGGSDTITNTIAICPNCHRKLHLGINRKKITELLYGKINRLVRE